MVKKFKSLSVMLKIGIFLQFLGPRVDLNSVYQVLDLLSAYWSLNVCFQSINQAINKMNHK